MNGTLEHVEIEDITEFVEALDGVLTLKPGPGDGSPEISWGDAFFYYAPDGVVPRTQPFATIVTKDYPGDEGSRLDRAGAFRLNIAAGREPRAPADHDVDASTPDVVFPHPVYGELGWLAIVNPGSRTRTHVLDLLQTAHRLARTRFHRRAGSGSIPPPQPRLDGNDRDR